MAKKSAKKASAKKPLMKVPDLRPRKDAKGGYAIKNVQGTQSTKPSRLMEEEGIFY